MKMTPDALKVYEDYVYRYHAITSELRIKREEWEKIKALKSL